MREQVVEKANIFGRIIGVAFLGFVAWALGGCVSASLATDTGPSAEGAWSVARRQDAHVGEVVRCSMVLKKPFSSGRLFIPDVADYAALFVGDERYEADPTDDFTRFEFEVPLEGLAAETTVPVRTQAYRLNGQRDHMKIRGQWRQTQSPYDQSDERVAEAGLTLRIYQSQIDHWFAQPAVELEWSTARLVLSRRDGGTSTVLLETPQRRGFSRSGPDEKGRCRIRYQPLAGEVDRTGQTRATLLVLDAAGRQHEFPFEFDTP